MGIDFLGFLAGLSPIGWAIVGFIAANALIAGVCVIERAVFRGVARVRHPG